MSEDFKKLTHKVHDCAVYVDQVQMLGSHKFNASAALVRNHEHFDDFVPTATCLNPMFLLEAARQIETIISHKYYGVAEDNHFVLLQWSFLYKQAEIRESDVLSVSISTQYVKRGTVKSNLFIISFFYEDDLVYKVSINVRYVTAQTYKLIRKNPHAQPRIYHPRSVLPEYVGYRNDINVCLSYFNGNELHSYAVVDIPSDNVVLNDHEQDHITGMNLSEAVKQTCYCYLRCIMEEDINRFVPVMMESTFFSYVENDRDAIIVISEVKLQGDSYLFSLDVMQGESKQATFKMVLRGNYDYISKYSK